MKEETQEQGKEKIGEEGQNLSRCSEDKLGDCSLLSEGLLLLLAPHVHHLPVLVHLHGVVHQAVHVDELDALLLGVEQHRRDDGQLTHLLLCVLTITGQRPRGSERERGATRGEG